MPDSERWLEEENLRSKDWQNSSSRDNLRRRDTSNCLPWNVRSSRQSVFVKQREI